MMVARGGAPVRSQNSGEIAPELDFRGDLKVYASAGRRFKNVEPVPASGWRQSPGSFDTGEVRPPVAGFAAETNTPTPGPHGAGTVTIWEGSFSVAQNVMAIDCSGISATAGIPLIWAEVFVAAVWTQLSPKQFVDATARGHSFASPPGATLNGTLMRLRATLAVGATITCGTVSVILAAGAVVAPSYASLTSDDGKRYNFALTEKFLDIYEDDAHVAGMYLPTVTAAMLPVTDFYSEADTLGIFHGDLETRRVARRYVNTNTWARDLWPYEGIPVADLGGVYTTQFDQWQVRVTRVTDQSVHLRFTVDGEKTRAQFFVDAANAETSIDTAHVANSEAKFKEALEELPSLGGTITVVVSAVGTTKFLTISFGGALTGREYDVQCDVVNTAEAAAFVSHKIRGKTDYEPLFSASRGWPGAVGRVQDRLVYTDVKAQPSAVVYSAVGEYFDLNIERVLDDGAIYDKLRGGNTIERVLAVTESVYLLLFTDRGVRLVPNRTIDRKTPRDYVVTATQGIAAGCQPIETENRVYYVARDPNDKENPGIGARLVSLAYSEIANAFEATPESLLASHLVRNIIRAKSQLAATDADASRIWMLRDDGRLVAGYIIASQDILGFGEWISATGGAVREIHVDGANAVRVAVQRGSQWRHERLDASTFLHACLTVTGDMAGNVTGLDLHEGREVWAVAEGYVLGPFTVAGGAIDLEEYYAGDIVVGLWQPPVWEGLPRWRELPNGDIVRRPGRIHAVTAETIDTTSLAIGANGGAAANVPLTKTSDPVDAPPAPKSGPFTRAGILGRADGTTAVITQKRPGTLRVKAVLIEEAL